MSAKQSMLAHYGYDVVVALSQVGVNEYLKPALPFAKAPLRYLCSYANSTAIEILTLDQLLKKTNGKNPFDIPNGTNSSDSADLQRLVESGLRFVIESQVGSYTLPRNERDIVSFTGHVASASYNLFHSHCAVGQVVPPVSQGAGSVWHSVAQTVENPWCFTVKAGMAITPLPDPQDWPPAVKKEAEKYTSCTVTLVAFQLVGAELLALPDIPGLQSGSSLQLALTTSLLPLDAQDTMNLGANVIGYWIQPSPADLSVVTALEHSVTPYLSDWNGDWNGPPPSPVADPTRDQANASTLNLLCAVDNDQVPTLQPFRWNWLRAASTQQYHGLIAVNAATFVKFLGAQLDRPAFLSCWNPFVSLHGNAEITVNEGAYPTLDTFVEGFALRYRFTNMSSDENWGVQVSLSTQYEMDVGFQPVGTASEDYASIVIVQSQIFDLDVKFNGQDVSTPIVSLWRQQTLPLAVSESGQIEVQSNGPPDQTYDFSEAFNIVQYDLDLAWLQENVEALQIDRLKKYLRPKEVAPSIVTRFFFPFGEAFSFADVDFSTGLDLFGHVTFLAGNSR